ncbi:MAG: hypothetical protein AB7D51_03080 [Desulfovibrionaceae bacterium]
MDTFTHLSGFKKVLELMRTGREEEATALQKSLQDEFLTLYDENETLKRQLTEVADVLDLSECMTFDGHKYWIEEDGKREGPFCQVCYDRGASLIRLTEHDRPYQCRQCTNIYMKPPEKKPAARPARQQEPKGPLKEPIPLFAKSAE